MLPNLRKNHFPIPSAPAPATTSRQHHHAIPGAPATSNDAKQFVLRDQQMTGLGALANEQFVAVQTPGNFKYSGWKLHIFSASRNEVIEILNLIGDLVRDNGCSMKAARDNFFEKNSSNEQRGKGITIYLPWDMINANRQHMFVAMLEDKLRSYTQSKGAQNISGDKTLRGGVINYRFDLQQPLTEEQNKTGGVSLDWASRNHRENAGGSHVIGGVKDIFG